MQNERTSSPRSLPSLSCVLKVPSSAHLSQMASSALAKSKAGGRELMVSGSACCFRVALRSVHSSTVHRKKWRATERTARLRRPDRVLRQNRIRWSCESTGNPEEKSALAKIHVGLLVGLRPAGGCRAVLHILFLHATHLSPAGNSLYESFLC